MTYPVSADGRRVFIPATQPPAITTMMPPNTAGTWLDEQDLIDALSLVQDRATQLGADSAGEL